MNEDLRAEARAINRAIDNYQPLIESQQKSDQTRLDQVR
jgi:hypothetical protein